MTLRSSGKPDASRTAERIVHSLFANSERKPPEGTGINILISLEDNPMQLLNLYNTNTTYRGIKYDVNSSEKHEERIVTMNYRGGTYTKKVSV